MYNALNDSYYTNPEDVEIIHLGNTISLSVRNDASFIVDAHINIYEHQSTYNPNMALRSLIYYGDIMKKLIKNRDLFSRSLITIPTPHFKVFYNGKESVSERQVFRLSDAFEHKTEHPEVELVCEMININKGYNQIFKEKCPILREYMIFVEKVSLYVEQKEDYMEAISEAIDECINEHILEEFLKSHRNEVLEVMTIDMTFERREVLIREEERIYGRAEGRVEGRIEGRIEDILELLSDLGDIPEELKNTVQSQRDNEILKKWHKLAAKATSFEEFKENM